MPRSGITLLEVLISIFVLAVGLLSVASLIPVASFQAQRAHVDDVKALVGPQAVRDVRNHGFLRPDYWRYPSGNPLVSTQTMTFGLLLADNNTTPLKGSNQQAGFPFPFPPIAIDPYVIKRFPIGSNPNIGTFAVAPSPMYNNERVQMLRMTCVNALGAAADQICQSLDDLVFDINASDPDALPTNAFNTAGTKRKFEGRFSWLATLVPVYGDGLRPGLSGSVLPIPVNRNAMILSVVVFNQRPTAIAPGTKDGSGNNVSGERGAQATFSGTGFPNPATRGAQGIAAGELQISSTRQSDLAVTVGEWIMLGTMINDANAPTDPTGPNTKNLAPAQQLPMRPFFRWYRIVSAGPIMQPNDLSNSNRSGTFARNLTLSGADWQVGNVFPTIKQKDGLNYPQFWAFIYDGAVAVYERTVRLEGPSMWSN